MSETVKKIRLDIIALLMVIVSVCFLGVFGQIISTALLIIYIKTAKEHYRFQKIILFLSFLGIALSISGIISMDSMENKGIDAIGEAILYGFGVSIGYGLTAIGSLLLLIIDNRKFIFRKKLILSVLVITIVVFAGFVLCYLLITEGVGKVIPTVGTFEKELISRGLKTSDTDYRLYGVDNKSDRAIALSFEKNNNTQYPLYVYSIIDYPWIIYYANGDIYAVQGKYWDYYTAYDRNTGYNEEKIIWKFAIDNIIKSEKEEVTVYNRKYNRYEKGITIVNDSFNYYSKDESIENSVFIDIPRCESWGSKVTQVDRLDREELGY